MRALLSVYDKSGLVPFAKGLADLGVELWGSGGTAKALREAGLEVRELSELTGFAALLGGRVKTLHPAVFAGVLAREDQLGELAGAGFFPFDLVAVNLYPFEATVRSGAGEPEVLEQIDIGGPALLRAAAKNHPRVYAVSDPADYPRVLEALKAGGDPGLRRELAAKAFAHTAAYDAAIADWFAREEAFPERKILVLEREARLRYGENPHQPAALYRVRGGAGPILFARVLQGKPMSYNNYADAEAAWRLVSEFEVPAAVAVKHQMPSGVGLGESPAEAYARAYAADPVSIFGGIVAFNRVVDERAAEAIGNLFLEVVLAPGFSEGARARFARKKNLRLLEVPAPHRVGLEYRHLAGGFLAQAGDEGVFDEVRVVTEEAPSEAELRALRFAMTVAKHARSNAIVVANAVRTLGIGQGQTSRVDAARIALERAGDAARGAVLASDGFFPFDDVVRLAAEYGIAAIAQPGGSKRDADSIQAANEAGIRMVFTGLRHFRH